ncbi:MAG: helix-turn-helix transcriptional regulator [Lachnospiraceae bacterium]|nr:helix-turn-helix transcriptional regulator [Lachnospiraceae bacterium]
MDKSKSYSTIELWAKLFQAPTVNSYLSENDSFINQITFSEYITKLCESKGEKAEKIIKRSNIDTSFGHRLFSGKRNPSRDTVLQLAFGFGMSVDETQQLLKISRHTPLHPKVKRDAVIAFFLNDHKPLEELQIALYDNKLPILGGKKHEQ